MSNDRKLVEERRKHFHYHAHAVGLAGHITHPFEHLIETQATSALPPTGGRSQDRVDDYRLHDLVSFKSAYTSTTGNYSESDGAFFTVSTSTIEKLDILGILTADKIVARVMSRHPYVDPKSKDRRTVEPEMVPLGCHFDKLVIAGHEVRSSLHMGALCDLSKYSDMRKHGRKRLGNAVHYMDDADPPIHCTLIDELEVGHAPELKVHDKWRNTIVVDQFGTIRLGEFIVNPYARRITMLKVRLGCGTEGILTVTSSEGNGSTPPPPTPGP